MIRTLSRRPDVLMAAALLLVYLAVMSGHAYSIDGVLMYRQAVSIAQNFSLRFVQPVHWGDVYSTSKYGIGLSLFYVPGVKLMGWLGFNPLVPQSVAYDSDLFYRDRVYAIVGAPLHIAITVVSAFIVARIVAALGFSQRTALFGLVAFGVASPAIVYAKGDFAQPLLGLCAAAGVLAVLRFRASRTWPAAMAAGAAVCIAVLARPVEGSFLVPVLIVMGLPALSPARWDAPTYRLVSSIVAGFAIAFAVTLAVNWGRFGSALETGYGQAGWGTPIWIGLPGVLISPARGILWEFPLIVLAPLAVGRLWNTPHRVTAAAISGLTVALLLNTALWVPWWGAWSWGSRLFVPALPLVAVMSAIGVGVLRPNLRRWLPAILFAGGVFWALPGTVTDILGGYAAAYDGSAQSFALAGYAPIGAWKFAHAVDVIWFRIARPTHDLSLLVPALLLALAVGLAYRAVQTGSPRVRAATLQTS